MKTFAPLLIFILFSATLPAQSFNIGISGGYDIPIASSFNYTKTVEFENQNFPHYYSTYHELANTSYGKGGNIAVTMDWYSAKNIGCGLKLNALISTPFSSSEDVFYLNGTKATFNFTDKPFSFQFVPHINFKHDFNKVSPYLEMGMLAGITHITQDYDAKNNTGSEIKSSINNKGNVLLGFYSSLGVAIKMSQVVHFTASVNCSAGSYSPAKWERTSFVVNGVDQLSSLRPSEKQGIYIKQLDLTATQSMYQPSQSLKYAVPFSNVGVNVGFLFVLGTKKTRTPEQIKRWEKLKKELNTNYFLNQP